MPTSPDARMALDDLLAPLDAEARAEVRRRLHAAEEADILIVLGAPRLRVTAEGMIEKIEALLRGYSFQDVKVVLAPRSAVQPGGDTDGGEAWAAS